MILVTGGAGYIGSHLCVLLIEAGYTPVVIDDLSNAHYSTIKAVESICGQPILFYQGDIADAQFVYGVMVRHNIGAVIHLAAKKAVEESIYDPLLYYDSNIKGIVNLLQVMEKVEVKSILYSSSATVYAPIAEDGIYSENDFLEPVNPYGWTKFMGERILYDMERTTSIIPGVLRYFNPVGAHNSGLIGENPKGKPSNLMPLLAEVVAGKREKLIIFGDDYDTVDGTAVRDFIHVMDVAAAHIRAIDILLEKKTPFTLNIGTGSGHSVKQIIESYERVNQIKLPVVMGKRRVGDVAKVYANVNKANEIMGWVATRSLDDMCSDLHRWVMNQCQLKDDRL
jgi:UDP-glucose 4-epimerase